MAMVNMPFKSIQLNEYPSTVYMGMIKEENNHVSSVEIIEFVYSPSHSYQGTLKLLHSNGNKLGCGEGLQDIWNMKGH